MTDSLQWGNAAIVIGNDSCARTIAGNPNFLSGVFVNFRFLLGTPFHPVLSAGTE